MEVYTSGFGGRQTDWIPDYKLLLLSRPLSDLPVMTRGTDCWSSPQFFQKLEDCLNEINTNTLLAKICYNCGIC